MIRNNMLSFLTIVLDSCRYDSFQSAKTPNIDSHFDVLEAGAMATFTYPAHAAMFQGFYPCTKAERPLYNRFALAKRAVGHSNRESLLRLFFGEHTHTEDVPTVPAKFREHGYNTVALGGVAWFKDKNPLCLGFEVFRHSPDANSTIRDFNALVSEKPFFSLLNFAETHRPFACPFTMDFEVESPVSANNYQSSYVPALHRKQIRAVEYLDEALAPLFSWLLESRKFALVCLCADHGEALGEDGCFGHGFYHPQVMSVPVAWSLFSDGRSQPVDYGVIETFAKDLP